LYYVNDFVFCKFELYWTFIVLLVIHTKYFEKVELNEMIQNFVKVGVGVIIVKHNKVLLGKRRNSHGDGEYSFPGGHLEFDESITQCAHREVMEETGLKLFEVHHESAYTDDWYPLEQKRYITLYVTAVTSFRAVPILKEPDKCEGWYWYDWEDLPFPIFQGIEKLKLMGFCPIKNTRNHRF
jgi:8-oxo-dGTP diphosphatase